MQLDNLFLTGIAVSAALLLTSCALPSVKDDNGITVDVKIYDSHALQEDINTLSDKLGKVSLIDQASLIAHLGALQGAKSSQFALNLQASGIGSPSVTTTTNSGTPSIAQVLGSNTTSGTAATQQTQGGTTPAAGQTVTNTPGILTTNTDQTTTNTPSATTQTVTATPSLSPTIPAVSSVPALLTPSTPSQSTVDLLGEQMQASYQILGLRAMLRGAQSDEYTADGNAMRHVTYGFPITITTPHRYEDKAAEIEISVCNPDEVQQNITPSLGLMLPQEKTYNVASLVSRSTGLGAGAVIAGVVNVGANVSSTHQTFYLVKQQDTVSLRKDRAESASACGEGRAAPRTFAWQFRPVLGQKTIDQGPRTTYAQLSFQPSAGNNSNAVTTIVSISSCWREYDANTGIVGRKIQKSCVSKSGPFTSIFDTLPIRSVDTIDNGNGTLTTTIHGHFLPSTRVGLGEAYLDESIPGFENSGSYIRFTSSAQLLAVRGARLLSPDGSIKEVLVTDEDVEPINYHVKDGKFRAPGNFQGTPQLFVDNQSLNPELKTTLRRLEFDAPPGAEVNWRSKLTLVRVLHPGLPAKSCIVPYANSEAHQATIAPFSDTLLEVSLPIWQCLEVGTLKAPVRYVVVMGGKAFGFSDAPFRSITDDHITFLVPSTFVQGLTTLELKRLFVDNQYSFTYNLKPSAVAVTGIALIGTSKIGATFVVTGSGLKHAHLVFPNRPVVWQDTYGMITLTADELASVKTLFLKPDNGSAPPIAIAVPTAKLVDGDTDSNKLEYSIVILKKNDTSTTYLVTALPEAGSLKNATFQAITPKSVNVLDDRHLQFELQKAEADAYKEVLIKLEKGPLLPLSLPTAKAEEGAAESKGLKLKKDDTGIAKGYTGVYTITGSGLDLIADIRYQRASLTYHLAPKATSVSVDLPAGFSANTGLVPLLIVPVTGDRQVFEVPVK